MSGNTYTHTHTPSKENRVSVLNKFFKQRLERKIHKSTYALPTYVIDFCLPLLRKQTSPRKRQMHVDQQETDSDYLRQLFRSLFDLATRASGKLSRCCLLPYQCVFIIFWPVLTANINIWLQDISGFYSFLPFAAACSLAVVLPTGRFPSKQLPALGKYLTKQ